MTKYVGLDVSMKETSICVVDGADKIVAEGKVASSPEAIAGFVARHAPDAERIGLETGSLSGWLWRGMARRGLPVILIDARHAHAGLKLQLNKTDRKDAQGLARIVRTGWYKEVHVRAPESQQARHLLAGRALLVAQRVDLENQLRGLLKGYGLVVGRVGQKGFGPRVEELIGDEPALQAVIGPLLAVRAVLRRQIAALHKQALSQAQGDPVTRRLMTLPGVGAITALAFRATIDDPWRFKNARAVGAYLGLTPRRYASGEIDRRGRISKCGDRVTRTCLYQAANVLLCRTTRWCALKAWALRLKKRVGHRKAAVALARKIAVVLICMWRDGTGFRWTRPPHQQPDTQAAA
jgi:transposase